MATDAIALRLKTQYKKNSSQTDVKWQTLERQDWHLWILSIFLIFVLGISLLGFMFPAAFWVADISEASLSQRAFFGFCALFGLVLIYLLQRQAAVRQLKRELFEAQAALLNLEREAVAEAYRTLPDTAQFRDALAMEFRRASTTGSNLSGVVIKTANASVEQLGYLARQIRTALRQGESLYRISDNALGIILPRLKATEVRFFSGQIEALGISSKIDFDDEMATYPDEVSTLSDLESRLRGLQTRN
jgi:hypothetical protein